MLVRKLDLASFTQPTKDTEVYTIYDISIDGLLTISHTVLKPHQQTRGHTHAGQAETYQFMGQGQMKLGEETFDVVSGDIVLIKDGIFHQVFNTTDEPLTFLCHFNGLPARPK